MNLPNLIAVALLALASIVSGNAASQEYPSKPIRLIVAFPPGGSVDLVARMLTERLRTSLGQNIVVENRAGANGAIGADYVAKSAPDGYTVFFTSMGAIAINPSMRADPPYDPIRDFSPVIRVASNTSLLVVRQDMPLNSVSEFAALAREKPGAITIATTGIGSAQHINIKLYEAAAGVSFVHVPYRGGAPALADLLGGQVSALFADAPILIPHIQSGKIKPIGAAADERLGVLPNVATFAEHGFQSVNADNWFGVLVPAGTQPAIITRLHDAFAEALGDPELRKKLTQSGTTPAPSSSEAFSKRIAADFARYGKILRDNNIKE